jgi:DNA polymerase (family X)
MASKLASNTEIADVLDRIGDLLEAKGENPFRINSYRRAATLVKDSDCSFARLSQEQGVLGLTKVKGIGDKLAGVIEEFVNTHKVALLEELEKEAPTPDPKEQKPSQSEKRTAKRSQPSAGTGLRNRGGEVKPLTSERGARGTNRLRNSSGGASAPVDLPPIGVILDVDAEYRKKAAEGSLKRIAPRQHNPAGDAWLSILSTSRGDWTFTVMFSNTALAHQLGKTDDWVVVYSKKQGEEERQCTVVTEHRGEMKGKRVVRGREAESQQHYT